MNGTLSETRQAKAEAAEEAVVNIASEVWGIVAPLAAVWLGYELGLYSAKRRAKFKREAAVRAALDEAERGGKYITPHHHAWEPPKPPPRAPMCGESFLLAKPAEAAKKQTPPKRLPGPVKTTRKPSVPLSKRASTRKRTPK